MLRKLLVALGVMLVGAASADATPFYLGFTGSNASGDVGGAAFSGTQWQLEYLIDPSPSDSSGQPEVGVFTGAIMSGELKLNGTMYELTGASATGAVNLRSFPGLYDQVLVFPDLGGSMSFLVAPGGIYPAAFTDNNVLSSVVLGTTLFDTTNGADNPSQLFFPFSPAGRRTSAHPGLLTTTDDINILDTDPPGSGHMSMYVSGQSGFTQQSSESTVPEPASMLLTGLGLGALYVARRRRNAA